MNRNQQPHRKTILSDPVGLFARLHPGASEEKIAALTRLQLQYAELKKQHIDKQNICKKISRQIGEAKRKAQPSDEFMQAMQEQSEQVNSVKNQLKDISSNIIDYFELDNNSGEPAERLPELLPERIHADQDTHGDKISIKQLCDENNAWNNYVKSNPAASIYHLVEWKDLIHKTFGHECYYFYAQNDNREIVGVLPLIRLKSRLFGDFMISMPFFNYGGAIANSITIEQKLMQAANSHAEQLGVDHIEYRDDIAREELQVRTQKVNMILSLPDNHEDLWNAFTSKLRSQIRRAQRERIRITFGGDECLEDFYAVFARNMRDLGTPVYGKFFFRNILQSITEHSKIVVVHIGNKPVAAAFLIGYNHTLEIPWASTIKGVNHLSINMLLYWEVLKFAIKNQYQYFDFGRSSKDSGTYRFKQQWGAKPKPLFWHYWLAGNVELPELNPDNPKYKMAISIWKQLPIFVTKWLGPLIVRNLP